MAAIESLARCGVGESIRYEGCARALVGDLDESNVIKLHRFSGKVSYITYHKFEKDQHPALRQRIKVTLPTLAIEFFDYSDWDDPPILYRKDKLIHSDHPLRLKFAKLSRQEAKYGILDNASSIITRQKLEAFLKELGLSFHGHLLRRDKPSKD